MTKATTYMAVSMVFILCSCHYFKKNRHPEDKDVIARVGDSYLYASDIKNLTRGHSGKDSTGILLHYAQDWVKKNLLLQKASENISDEDVGISKKVEDYRESLVLYEYEKALINQKLDTVISAAEMNQWYDKVKSDFPLSDDVYLFNFIELKTNAPDLDKARKWILKPKDEDDTRKMQGYCKDVAISSSIDDGMWYEKENALKNFPITESDMNSLLASKKFKEFKNDENIWFLRITDIAKAGTASPLDLIKDKIVKMILEKRKMLLLDRTYNRIYQDGKESKSFDIYVKP